MRDTFVKTLTELACKNKNIELVTGDLGFGVLKPYWETVPDQFTNAGIAEQNMTGLAAGMALAGKTVFTYSIGNFPTMRCLEQIRNDCAYMNANVKIVCIGGGFVYGSLGMSHQATEDMACMRALPGVKVFAPGDLVEAKEVTKALVNVSGTCYLRLGRGGEKQIHKSLNDFHVGKAIEIRNCLVREGKKIAVLSTGAILDDTFEACTRLEQAGFAIVQYSFPTVKPLDTAVINYLGRLCDYIVTVEEHNMVGGFGGAVAETLSEAGRKAVLKRIGINDRYCSLVGDQKFLRNEFDINAEGIYTTILNILNE